MLHFSIRKDFDPETAEETFSDWHEILKYFIQSPKVYQDITQFHLINKIENLEYNYDFVSLLLREY